MHGRNCWKKNASMTTRSKKNLPSKFLTDHHFYILFHYDKNLDFWFTSDIHCTKNEIFH